MLAVSTLGSNNNPICNQDGRVLHQGDQTKISCTATGDDGTAATNNCTATGFSRDDFPAGLSGEGGNLFDSIDLDDLFAGINDVGDALPDSGIDPDELLAEFSVSPDLLGSAGDQEESFSCGNYNIYESNNVVSDLQVIGQGCNCDDANTNNSCNHDDTYVMNYSASENNRNNNAIDDACEGDENGGDRVSAMETGKEEEIESKKMGELPDSMSPANFDTNKVELFLSHKAASDREGDRRKKWSSQGKNNYNTNNMSNSRHNNSQAGKRKTKVDWTPELHRRFVQAVEQLGVDKAVPSRILELMGIDCLTRHNVASHLQKYRSHRRHLLARGAEAPSWTQKRQMYGGVAAVAPVAGTSNGIQAGCRPWNGPTMGFPPPLLPPPMHHHPSFRPLHVWGHPTRQVEPPQHHHHRQQYSMMPVWPKHIASSPSANPPPHHAWTKQLPMPLLADTPFWHSHHLLVSNGLSTAPCFPQPLLSTTRFAAPPVPCIPPPSHPAAMYSNKPHHNAANAPLDFHPTKESIDAAIGDALCKPWLPLPIGLKPPSVDGVLVELQRQGIPKVPPPHLRSNIDHQLPSSTTDDGDDQLAS